MIVESGVCKKWVSSFGWVTPDGGGPDCFLHYSVLPGEGFRQLREGDRIRFIKTTTPRGPRVERVIEVGA